MIGGRLGLAAFSAIAKEVNWTAAFKDVVINPDSDFRATVATKNLCDICETLIEPGTPVLQAGFINYHFQCFETFKCGGCNVELSPTTFDGIMDERKNVVCKTCRDSMHSCLGCQRRQYPQDLNEGYCVNCLIRCHECGTAVPLPKTIVTNGSRHCMACGRRHIWVKPYNFNPLEILDFQGKPKNKLYMGVELEIEADTKANAVDLAETITKKFGKYLVVKHDGSLEDRGHKGLELVTAPGDFAFHKGFWEDFFNQGYQFESKESRRCSTHVHVSKQALTNTQIARMGAFMYNRNTRGLIEHIAERNLTNEWAERYAYIGYEYELKDFAEVYGTTSYYKRNYGVGADTLGLTLPNQRKVIMKAIHLPRYTAMNLSNKDTVEFRIFRGTSDYETMLKNLEFCQSVIDFCNPTVVSLKDLKDTKAYRQFVITNRSAYPHLIKFLLRGGFILKRGKLLSV